MVHVWVRARGRCDLARDSSPDRQDRQTEQDWTTIHQGDLQLVAGEVGGGDAGQQKGLSSSSLFGAPLES